MSNTRSVDGLIAQVEQQKLNPSAPPVPNIEPTPHIELAPEVEAPEAPVEVQAEPEQAPEPKAEAHAEDEGEAVDDYGNKTAKPKMYTREEVERMMRDRLRRGKASEGDTQQQQTQAKDMAKDFQVDPSSDETWEQQLERFIDKRLETKFTSHEKERAEREWRGKQEKIQAEFEVKFSTGMSKYSDFQDVVQSAPLTDTMVLATRTLDDPAAFLYAASKTQRAELERIAKMPDALQQAAEMGRLEAKMRKGKASASRASKPLKSVKGDMPDSGRYQRPSIDARIHEYGQQKIIKR